MVSLSLPVTVFINRDYSNDWHHSSRTMRHSDGSKKTFQRCCQGRMEYPRPPLVKLHVPDQVTISSLWKTTGGDSKSHKDYQHSHVHHSAPGAMPRATRLGTVRVQVVGAGCSFAQTRVIGQEVLFKFPLLAALSFLGGWSQAHLPSAVCPSKRDHL